MSPVSEKPRKQYKGRERDPIKLILERGIRQKVIEETYEDDDGEEQVAKYAQPLPPIGVVLHGDQVALVAAHLMQTQTQMQVLRGLVQEYQRMLEEEDISPTIGATDVPDVVAEEVLDTEEE